MTATVVPMLRGGRFRVYCTEHNLDRTVETEAHATNLAQLHDRKDHAGEAAEGAGVRHPETFNVSAAADYLLVVHADAQAVLTEHSRTHAEGAYFAALDLFQALTGLPTTDAALEYARTIRTTGVKAAPIPF